ncbi:insecticidal delta-endotoxin Cry8Ea1 family protein [Bacillus thuringiensis]|uniref:insecticidal delta-endotoxin Cry8Ea1 family protein n=1 Tax=Bacillus thuringiensis TaxID=1428 RepID=UPI003D14083A|nr:insecticidal toxin protein [Bacillus thuringiensis]
MNSYENKNEYEILDTSQNNSTMSNRYQRYPLANNPQMPARSNHYKDWQNIYDSKPIDYRRIGSSPEAYIASRDAIFTGVSIVSTILGYFGFGFISGAIGVVSSLVGLLWRDNSIWENLIRHIEGLIDERIRQDVLNGATASLAGLRNVMLDFNNALELWRENPSGTNADRVVLRFATANGVFRNAMPSFSRQGYEVLLLSVYAQAANLHLLLLRDFIRFATELEKEADVDINHREQLERMEEYTSHCTNTYSVGLNRLRGTTAAQWLRFNQFRREMTLTVLDLVACFPVYDFRRYPANTQVELSRLIYTDPVVNGGVAQTETSSANFNALENEFIGTPPVRVTWLDNVQISTGEMRRTTTWNTNPGIFVTNVWHGNSNVLGNQNSELTLTTNFGTVTNNRTNLNMSGNDIFRVDLRAHATFTPVAGMRNIYGIGRSQFFNVRGSNLIYDNPPGTAHPSENSIQNVTVSLPGERSEQPTANDYIHRLADVRNISGGLRTNSVHGRSSFVGHVWTHRSLNRRNVYSFDRITQIPAVKSDDIFSHISTIPGPGSTGGMLLRATVGNILGYNLQNANDSQTINANYKVRFRYACDFAGRSLIIRIGNISKEVRFERTTDSLINLSFNNFGYAETEDSFRIPAGIQRMTIQNNSPNPGRGDIVIDKIEIIPTPPITPGNYQIVTALNRSSVLDLNPGTPRVNLWRNNRGTHQIWSFRFDYQRNAYVIRNLSHPRLALTWDFTSPNSIVFAAPFSPGRQEQYWIAESFQDGFVLINLRNRNMVLDVAGEFTTDGTNIIAFTRHNGNGQRFLIIRP